MTKGKDKDKVITFVVKYEQFFELPEDDAESISESVENALETMRAYAGARVTGSYSFEGKAHDNEEFVSDAIQEITLPVPTVLRVD